MVRPYKITLLHAPGHWLTALDPPTYTPRPHRLLATRLHLDERQFSHQRDWHEGEASMAEWETYVVPYPDLLHGRVAHLPVLITAHERGGATGP